MINYFTYSLSHKNENSSKTKSSVDNSHFEPSEKSVKTILDFAKAYHPVKLKSCDENDIVLN